MAHTGVLIDSVSALSSLKCLWGQIISFFLTVNLLICLSSTCVLDTHTHTHSCSVECVESFWPVCFCSVTPSAQASIHDFTAIVMLLLLIHSPPFKLYPALPPFPFLSLFFPLPPSQVKSWHGLLLFLLQRKRRNEMFQYVILICNSLKKWKLWLFTHHLVVSNWKVECPGYFCPYKRKLKGLKKSDKSS